jgi:hypothetical protein
VGTNDLRSPLTPAAVGYGRGMSTKAKLAIGATATVALIALGASLAERAYAKAVASGRM